MLKGKSLTLTLRRCHMGLYTAFDLHSSNSYLGIIDDNGKRIFKRKLRNDPDKIKEILMPFKPYVEGIVVESTYNWYWLVDLLKEEGYRVHLANPSKIQQYSGMKYSDDKHDAFWLAEMLRLGILPEGYIYPKEERPIRDLLRKRSHLVRLRTAIIVSLQNIIARNLGRRLKVNDVKILTTDRVTPLFQENEDLALAGKVSKEAIDFMTKQIKIIETTIHGRIHLSNPYDRLLSIPGVGKILAFTIMLETGPIERFQKVGNYVSYCRKVPSARFSNDKKKGTSNRRNGNKYLAWAFSEVSDHARLYDSESRRYYQRKLQKTNAPVAHNALAHKLARAAYYIMRDGVVFMPTKAFG
jgi:transposase